MLKQTDKYILAKIPFNNKIKKKNDGKTHVKFLIDLIFLFNRGTKPIMGVCIQSCIGIVY